MIGQPRMDRYLRDCGGDQTRAHDLFTWNVAISGALHEAMHMFEIVLRNALDRELSAWNVRQGHKASWLLDPNKYLLRVLDVKSLETARFRAKKVATAKGRLRTHDDVLAQMTLGTWRYLLPSKASAAKRRLWSEAVSRLSLCGPGHLRASLRGSRQCTIYEIESPISSRCINRTCDTPGAP